MSLAKFAWAIQNHSLWLSRADLLGDPWEISLSGNQLQHVIKRHPISSVFDTETRETAEERSKRIINLWRMNTYVCCWNNSHHESNALWKIYCGDSDGVAIQTTVEKLKGIKEFHEVYKVTYPKPGENRVTPTHTDLVTKKRPMFSYEKEVRIVFHDKNKEKEGSKGIAVPFDIEHLIESIRVHPEANSSYYEVIATLIKTYLPEFSGNLGWSDMRIKPPF